MKQASHSTTSKLLITFYFFGLVVSTVISTLILLDRTGSNINKIASLIPLSFVSSIMILFISNNIKNNYKIHINDEEISFSSRGQSHIFLIGSLKVYSGLINLIFVNMKDTQQLIRVPRNLHMASVYHFVIVQNYQIRSRNISSDTKSGESDRRNKILSGISSLNKIEMDSINKIEYHTIQTRVQTLLILGYVKHNKNKAKIIRIPFGRSVDLIDLMINLSVETGKEISFHYNNQKNIT